MKKQYIKPIVMLIDTDILSNVMAASGSESGGASANYGGGTNGDDNPGGGDVTTIGDNELDGIGTKGSIFTWYDDEDEEYCY